MGVRGGMTAVDGASESTFRIGVHLGRQAEAQSKVYHTFEAGFCQPMVYAKVSTLRVSLGSSYRDLLTLSQSLGDRV